MKHTTVRWSTLLGACAVTLVGVAGCADRNKDNIPESPATSGEISNTVDNAADATTNAVGDAAESTETIAANAATTGKIETAFAANASLKALEINTTTMSDKKTVTLAGTVTNAAQKNLAGQIAKQNAPADFKIVNNLQVAGGASPKMNPPANKS